jgi:hypothetical protein
MPGSADTSPRCAWWLGSLGRTLCTRRPSQGPCGSAWCRYWMRTRMRVWKRTKNRQQRTTKLTNNCRFLKIRDQATHRTIPASRSLRCWLARRVFLLPGMLSSVLFFTKKLVPSCLARLFCRNFWFCSIQTEWSTHLSRLNHSSKPIRLV